MQTNEYTGRIGRKKQCGQTCASTQRVVLALLVSLLSFLLGCAPRLPPRGTPVPPPEPSTPSSMPQPTITQRPSSPDEALQTEAIPPKPVADLLAKAETELQTGQLERSAASLERALRIAPRTAVLWQRLAQVHLQQGDARQAEAMAMKSSSLVSAGSALLRKNWEIIAVARQRLGDPEGARYAAEQAQRAGSARERGTHE